MDGESEDWKCNLIRFDPRSSGAWYVSSELLPLFQTTLNPVALCSEKKDSIAKNITCLTNERLCTSAPKGCRRFKVCKSHKMIVSHYCLVAAERGFLWAIHVWPLLRTCGWNNVTCISKGYDVTIVECRVYVVTWCISNPPSSFIYVLMSPMRCGRVHIGMDIMLRHGTDCACAVCILYLSPWNDCVPLFYCRVQLYVSKNTETEPISDHRH